MTVSAYSIFQEQACKTPKKIAIQHGDSVFLSYAQVDESVNAISAALVDLGIGKGSLVPCFVQKDPSMVISFLAVLKAGAAYVPLEPEHPQLRTAELVKDINPSFILTHTSLLAEIEHRLSRHGIHSRCLSVDQLMKHKVGENDSLPALSFPSILGSDAAYVLFTSGTTTGRPKGVCIEHANIVASIQGSREVITLPGPGLRTAVFSSISFDMITWDLYATWERGGTLFLAQKQDFLRDLPGMLDTHCITFLETTPAIFALIQDKNQVPFLRLLLSGGEPMTVTLRDRFATDHHFTLVNGYGPSEITVYALAHRVLPDSDVSVIGTPFGLNTVQIQDAHGKVALVGDPGELVIFGPQVGRGYHGDIESSMTKFYHTNGKPSRYRTGDIARRNQDGTISFIGRADDQFKIRGFRIEPAEVEAVLCRQKEIKQVCCIKVVTKNHQDLLAAFVVATANGVTWSAREDGVPDPALAAQFLPISEALGSLVSSMLPSHMRPTIYIPVDSLPMTANNKIDRRLLRHIYNVLAANGHDRAFTQAARSRSIVSPQNTLETTIRNAWCQLLNLSPSSLSTDDHFFSVGGDSLLAIRLCQMLKFSNIALEIDAVFLFTTIQTQARHVAEHADVDVKEVESHSETSYQPFSLLSSPIVRETILHELLVSYGIKEVEVDDILPVTPLQGSLISLNLQGDAYDQFYMTEFHLTVPSGIPLSRFASAWKQLIKLHPILRTGFHSSESGILQVVYSPESDLGKGAELRLAIADGPQALTTRFSFGSVMFTAAVLDKGNRHPDESIKVQLLAHHALFDGESLELLSDQLSAILRNDGSTPRHTPFATAVSYLTHLNVDDSLEFWKEKLKDAESLRWPPASLPKRHGDLSFQRGNNEYLSQMQSAKWHGNLGPLASECQVTQVTIFQLALAVVLSKMSQQQDVLFHMVSSGRSTLAKVGIDNVAGPCAVTLPVRITLNSSQKAEDSILVGAQLETIRDNMRQALQHDHVGLAQIRKAVDARSTEPFSGVLLTYQPRKATNGQSETGIFDQQGAVMEMEAKINLIVQPKNDALELVCLSRPADIDPMSVSWFLRHLCAALSSLSNCNGQSSIDEIELVDEEERKQLLDWSFPRPRQETTSGSRRTAKTFLIQDLIDEQARSTPLKIAIQFCDDISITYDSLRRKSDALASYLVSLGMGEAPGELVPIFMNPSVELYVTILAVLKTGAAYVPLDPEHPKRRTSTIIDDIKARFLLTTRLEQPSVTDRLSDSHVRVISVPEAYMPHISASVKHERRTIKGSDLAYVVMTSGTTGTAKGICVEHSNLVASVLGACHELMPASYALRTLAFSSPAFDMSIWDWAGTLSRGGTLCAAPKHTLLGDLTSVTDSMAATFIETTSTVLSLYRAGDVPFLQTILPGGEPLSPAVQEQLSIDFSLLNTYGPSEITVSAVSGKVGPRDPTNLIGRALGQNRVFVVRTHTSLTGPCLRLCAVGEAGEIAISGPQVSRGYLNLAELTTSKFVRQPFDNKDGHRRMFLTGDLGCWSSAGELMLLGRADHQIKIRGHRVEPAEITQTVTQICPELSGSAVLKTTVSGRECLVLFVAPVTGIPYDPDGAPRAGDSNDGDYGQFAKVSRRIFHRIKEMLPSYMVPSYIYPLFELPSTFNHKVDLVTLRNIHSKMESLERHNHFGRPQQAQLLSDATETERKLVQLWAATLARPTSTCATISPFALDDHFYSAGGDSLLAIRLSVQAAKQGLSLSVPDIFSAPTIRAQALLLDQKRHESHSSRVFEQQPFELISPDDQISDVLQQAEIDPAEVQDMYPATPMQESLISVNLQSEEQKFFYMAHMQVLLPPTITLNGLGQGWKALVSQTPILRTGFVMGSKGILQVVYSPSSQEATRISTLRHSQGPIQQVEFRLGTCPVTAFTANRKDGSGLTLMLSIHHSIYDGEMLHLLSDHLRILCQDPRSQLDAQPFSRFVSWLKHFDCESSAVFWKEYLAGCKQLDWPSAPLSSRQTAQAYRFSRTSRETNYSWKGNLKQSASTHAVSSVTLFQLALALALRASLSDDQDILFHLVSSGRSALTQVTGMEQVVGPCVTTVPVRIKLEDSHSVVDSLKSIETMHRTCLPHEHFGLSNIRKAAGFESDRPLSTILLTFQGRQEAIGQNNIDFFSSNTDMEMEARVNLLVDPVEEGLRLTTFTRDSEADPQDVLRLLERIGAALNLLVDFDSGSLLLSSLRIIGDEERRLQLEDWCHTQLGPDRAAEYENLSRFNTIHQAFTAQSKQTPRKVAVQTLDGNIITYEQLEHESNLLASRLVNFGVHGSSVPFLLRKDIDLYVGILGILKSNAAYVALDSEHPLQRKARILSQVDTTVILTSRACLQDCEELIQHYGKDIEIVCIDDGFADNHNDDDNDPNSRRLGLQVLSNASKYSAAYMVFTSGTTGEPKGIIVEHGNLLESIAASRQVIPVGRTLAFSSPSFDLSVWDWAATLTQGGTICVASKTDLLLDLTNVTDKFVATTIETTSTVLAMLDPAQVPFLQTILPGGEPMSLAVQDMFSSEFQLLNTYGPSEISVSAISARIRRDSPCNLIGRPLGKNRVYIVRRATNCQAELCSIGQAGELAIAGPQVARGYLKLPQATASSFIINPFNPGQDDERMFLTGDLAKWTTDGHLLLLGRLDSQIKIRGFRVEPAEIENAISCSSEGRVRSVICLKMRDVNNHERLVAFLFMPELHGNPLIVPKIGQIPDFAAFSRSVTETLHGMLPAYMVPWLLLPISRVPYTINNKIDRPLLLSIYADLESERGDSRIQEYIADLSADSGPPLMTAAQQVVAEAWQQVLGRPALSFKPSDHFIASGGDSLLAIRLTALLRGNGADVTIRSIFDNPTLAAQAMFVSGINGDDKPIKNIHEMVEYQTFSLLPPEVAVDLHINFAKQLGVAQSDVEDILPAAVLQEALVSLALQSEESRGMYMATIKTPIPDKVDLVSLAQAWNLLVNKHAILRTAFMSSNHGLMQVVYQPEAKQAKAAKIDLAEQDSAMTVDFELGQCPIAADIVKDGRTSLFILTIHHALYDGGMITILSQHMNQLIQGARTSDLISIPYNHFVKWQRNKDQEEFKSFWARYLEGGKALMWPDLSSSATSYASSTASRTNERTATFAGDLHTVACTFSVSPVTIFQLALSLVLSRYVGEADVILQIVSSGRSELASIGLESVVGPCVSTFPLRTKVSPSVTLRQALHELHSNSQQCIANEHYGLANIRKASGLAGSGPLSTVMLTYQGLIDTSMSETDLNAEVDFFAGKVDMSMEAGINLIVDPKRDSLELTCRFREPLVDRHQVDHLLEHLCNTLSHILELSKSLEDAQLGSISMSSEHERKLVQQWGTSRSTSKAAQEVAFLRHCSVTTAFQAQVQATPLKIAVQYKLNEFITYQSLDHISSQMAHAILATEIGKPLGERTGDFVERPYALFLEKGIEQIATVLAVLKAGKSYVAIDLEHPATRTAVILQISRPLGIITSKLMLDKAQDLLSGADGSAVPIHAVEDLSQYQSASLEPLPVPSRILPAYYVFTSGTSGRPKGICVTNQQLVHSISASRDVFPAGSYLRTLGFSGLGFDMSVWDMFSTLTSGGTLCLAPKYHYLSDMGGMIASQAATFLETTSTVLSLIRTDRVPFLQTILPGGEPLRLSIRDSFASDFQLLNTYGPSEITVSATSGQVHADEVTCLIGKPLGGNLVYVVHADRKELSLCAVAEPGEIVIGGKQVSKGYVGLPELTRSKYVKNTIISEEEEDAEGARVFRTGDRGYWRWDGQLVLLGRIDAQVKIRGFRVELAEISRTIFSQFSHLVADVSCLKVEQRNGSDGVVAFLIPRDSSVCIDLDSYLRADLNVETLRRFAPIAIELSRTLVSLLPAYMVPFLFIPIAALPLTVNNKVDESKLRAWIQLIQDRNYDHVLLDSGTGHSIAVTPSEMMIAKTWGELLSVAPGEMDVDRHFVAMGGDSLLAIKLSARLMQGGKKVSLEHIFKYPTVRSLAAYVDQAASHCSVARDYHRFSLVDPSFRSENEFQAPWKYDVEDILPCTPLQEAVLAATIAFEDTSAYLGRLNISLPSDATYEKLAKCWDVLLSRHPILRTVFSISSDSIVQVVLAASSRFLNRLERWDDAPAWSSTETGQHWVRAMLRGNGDVKHLELHLHHALYDGTMLRLLLQDLSDIYHSYTTEPTLIPFSHFMASLGTQSQTERINFWQQNLTGAQKLCWPPSASAASTTRTSCPARRAFKQLHFDRDLVALCQSWLVTPSAIVQALLAILLSRQSGQRDVLFGVISSGRTGLTLAGSASGVVGPCVANVPLRVKLCEDETLETLVRRVQADHHESLAYAHVSLRDIKCILGIPPFVSVYEVLLVFQDFEQSSREMCRDSFNLCQDDAHLPMQMENRVTLEVTPSKGGLLLECSYLDSQDNSSAELSLLLDRLYAALESLFTLSKQAKTRDLKSLSRQEERQVDRWSKADRLNKGRQGQTAQGTAFNLKDCSSLAQALLVQATLTPKKVALQLKDDDFVTYEELVKKALRLSKQIDSHPTQMVGVLMSKTPSMVTVVVAILLSGKAYVPLDPSHPIKRTSMILQDAQVTLLFIDDQLGREARHALSEAENLRVMEVSSNDDNGPTYAPESMADALETAMNSNSRREKMAYLIFTTGTTGRPKGICVEHGMALHAIEGSREANPLHGKALRTAVFASPQFDMIVYDIWMPLLSGGTVCLISREELLDDLVGHLNRMSATLFQATPAVLEFIDAHQVPSLRVAFSTGDLLTAAVRDSLASQLILINAYGPSEVTVYATFSRVEPTSDVRVIGRPFGTQQAYIYSGNRQCGLGEPGELIISGPQISRGYWASPDLTAQSYMTNFTNSSSHPAFRTGDIASWLADGSILFHGRRDSQTKLRGYRIEMQDVEHNIMRALPPSIDAAVCIKSVNRQAQDCLVCFLACRKEATNMDPNKLIPIVVSIKAQLGRSLPNYMIPSLFLPISDIPLNANGKVDRRKLVSLHRLHQENGDERLFNPPPSPTPLTRDKSRRGHGGSEYDDSIHRQLATHWMSVLRLQQRPGVDDDFYSLGGDSILALKLSAALRAQGLLVPASVILGRSSLRGVSDYLRESATVDDRDADSDILPFSLVSMSKAEAQRYCAEQISDTLPDYIQDVLPCSPMQEGLVSIGLSDRDSMYVTSMVGELPSFVVLSQLQKAWACLVAFHPILRTVFLSTSHGIWQVVLEPNAPLVRAASEMRQTPCLGQIEPLRFETGKTLVRAYVESSSVTRVLIQMHHAIFDGYTLNLLSSHLAQLYYDIRRPFKVAPYSLYLKAVTGDQSIRDAAHFWKKKLEAFSPLRWPPSELRRVVQADFSAGDRDTKVHESVWRGDLSSFCKDTQITASTALQASVALVLRAYQANDDILFGSISSGRLRHDALDLSRIAGPCTAIVPLRVIFQPGETVSSFVRRLGAETTQAAVHEQIGLSAIQRLLGMGRTRLFDMTLTYQGLASATEPEVQGNLPIDMMELATSMDFEMLLSLVVTPSSDGLLLKATCSGHRLGSTVRMFLDHVCDMLDQLTSLTNRETICTELVVRDPVRKSIQASASPQSSRSESSGSVMDRFKRTAARFSKKVALQMLPDRFVTFAQLDHQSDVVAAAIKRQMPPKSSVVTVFMEKSVEYVVSIFGVLKAGYAFCPLDVSHPPARTQQMLEDAASVVMLTSTRYRQQAKERATQADVSLICVSDLSDSGTGFTPSILEPDTLVAVIFTSGTTGRPKGVKIHNSMLVSSLEGALRHFELPRTSLRTIAAVSICFDPSLWDIFLPLINGGTACLISKDAWLSDATRAVEHSMGHFIAAPSSMLSMLRPSKLVWMHSIVAGGEPLSVNVHDDFAKTGTCALFNAYGPTEAGVAICARRIKSIDRRDVIGKPYGGNAAYVLDEMLRPCAIGVPGQLYIAGSQLSHGYFGQEERTRERFITNPFCGKQKMYATGDFASWTPEQELVFLGRRDNQVKLRGYRIELGEVERTALECHGCCKASCLLVRSTVRQQDLLVAFVVPRTSNASLEGEHNMVLSDQEEFLSHIRSYLSAHLPEYMQPAVVLALRGVPLTSNGKTDHQELTDLFYRLEPSLRAGSAIGCKDQSPPKSGIEHRLASAWETVLGLDAQSVRIDQNFAALGGDSLLSARLSAVLREEGSIALTAVEIMSNPTIRQQASLIADRAHSEGFQDSYKPFSLINGKERIPSLLLSEPDIANPVHLEDVQDCLPCTPMQESLIAHSVSSEGRLYMSNFAFRLSSRSPNSLERLEAAWTSLCSRQSILRTVFVSSPARMLQLVMHPSSAILNRISRQKSQLSLDEWLRQQTTSKETRFHVDQHALYPFIFTDTASGSEYFVLILHHALYDGHSMHLLQAQLEALYEDDETASAINSNLSYAAAVAQILRLATDDSSSSYWEKLLKDRTPTRWPPQLNEARPTPAFPATAEVRQWNGPILEWCRQIQVTPASVVHFVVGWILSLYTGSTEVMFGSISSGREAIINADQAMGPLITHIPFACSIEAQSSLSEAVRTVHDQLRSAIQHQHVGLSTILSHMKHGRSNLALPYDVVLTFQNVGRPVGPTHASRNGNLSLEPYVSEMEMELPLHLDVTPNGQGLELRVQCSANGRIDPNIVSFFLDHVGSALDSICRLDAHASDRTPVDHLNFFSASDRSAQLETYSCMQKELSNGDETVLNLFDRMAERMPRKIAVDGGFDGKTQTYQQLHDISLVIADQLRHVHHVSQGQLVPMLFSKSTEAIAVILGVLRAGCAYVPLDPKHPSERLSYIVQQCSSNICLVQDGLEQNETILAICSSSPSYRRVPFASLTGCNQVAKGMKTAPSLSKPVLSDAAYCLFTSGTSGKPKGVLAEHGNLMAYVRSAQGSAVMAPNARRYCFAALTFDVSVGDIFSTLCSGACLCLDTEDRMLGDLAGSMNMAAATTTDLTPTVARLIQGSCLPFLDRLCLSGEPLPRNLAIDLGRTYRISNTCGPTETVVQAMAHDFSQHQAERLPYVPLGRPTGELRIYVVKPGTLELVPVGCPGEMLISGDQVTRGYLNEPELSRDKFIVDPFHESPTRSRRMFRSGDVGRLHADGCIEHLGRIDSQLKLNGLRIESREIEAVLESVAFIEHCSVDKIDLGGENQLIAYVSLGKLALSKAREDEIWKTLEAVLPRYMVPALVFVSDRGALIPTTASGKIDKRALAKRIEAGSVGDATLLRYNPARQDKPVEAISETVRTTRDILKPISTTEQVLREAWSLVLNLDEGEIPLETPFSQLGGSSIRSMRLLSSVRRLGLRGLLISDVDSGSTIISQAQAIERHKRRKEEKSQETEIVVTLRQEATNEIALVLVHDYTGSIFAYRDMTKWIDGRINVYAIVDPSLEAADQFGTIEEIGELYGHAIRASGVLGRHEKTMVGGWSLGGAISLELTRHVRVDGLVLLDTHCPYSSSAGDEDQPSNEQGGEDGEDVESALAAVPTRMEWATRLQAKYGKSSVKRQGPVAVAANALLVSAAMSSANAQDEKELGWSSAMRPGFKLQVRRSNRGHFDLLSTPQDMMLVAHSINEFGLQQLT